MAPCPTHAGDRASSGETKSAGLRRFCRALFRTRTGDPSLPFWGHGNWSQPTATVFAYFSRFRGRSICHRLPPVATARLHKRSIPCVNWRARRGLKSVAGGVRERRRRLAADDRRRLVNEFVVRERVHHEKGEVDAAREVALEDWIADVPAPDGQTLALALLEVAPAHDGPERVAAEHAPTRLNLVVQVGESSDA